MKKTSFLLDSETRMMLDKYCHETGLNFSDSIRHLLKEGIDNYQKKKTFGPHELIGPSSLMLNEQRAIRSIIECLYLMRSLIKDPQVLEQIADKTDEILKEGWHYGS